MSSEIKVPERMKAKWTPLVLRIVVLGAATVLAIHTGREFAGGYMSGGDGAFRTHRATEPIAFWIATSGYSAFIAMLFYLGLRRYSAHQTQGEQEPNQAPAPTAPSGRGSP